MANQRERRYRVFWHEQANCKPPSRPFSETALEKEPHIASTPGMYIGNGATSMGWTRPGYRYIMYITDETLYGSRDLVSRDTPNLQPTATSGLILAKQQQEPASTGNAGSGTSSGAGDPYIQLVAAMHLLGCGEEQYDTHNSPFRRKGSDEFRTLADIFEGQVTCVEGKPVGVCHMLLEVLLFDLVSCKGFSGEVSMVIFTSSNGQVDSDTLHTEGLLQAKTLSWVQRFCSLVIRGFPFLHRPLSVVFLPLPPHFSTVFYIQTCACASRIWLIPRETPGTETPRWSRKSRAFLACFPPLATGRNSTGRATPYTSPCQALCSCRPGSSTCW